MQAAHLLLPEVAGVHQVPAESDHEAAAESCQTQPTIFHVLLLFFLKKSKSQSSMLEMAHRSAGKQLFDPSVYMPLKKMTVFIGAAT